MILVKILQAGAAVQEYAMNVGDTVGDLLDAAGMEDVVIGNVHIGSMPVDENTVLGDNNKVYIGAPTKGNGFLEVKIMRVGASGSAVSTILVETGTTIKEVIEKTPDEDRGLYFDATGRDIYEYRIGSGSPVPNSTPINGADGSIVRLMLTTVTKGNR